MPDIEKEFVQYVVKSLVSNPAVVDVERSEDERGPVLNLTVDPVDMGKVIGRSGATAKSLRTLLRVMSVQQGQAVRLKIVEPEGAEDKQDGRATEMAAAEPAQEDAIIARHAKAKQEIAELNDLEL